MEVITFETDRFNLTKERGNFINPCCFGEDFANWLKPKLESQNIRVIDIYQEDWGWELFCTFESQPYYIGVGGILDESGKPDFGEWRLMFTKKRKLIDILLGKNKLSKSEKIFGVIETILKKEDFLNVSYE